MSLNGDSRPQALALQCKCEQLASAFAGCHLSPADVTQGYQSILIPGLRYGMSATTITQKQLRKSQQIISKVILPKLGYNRHMPRQVVYAPKHFGGIGLLDLSVEQGLAQLLFLLRNLRTKTDVTETIHTLIESYMIRAGTTKSPFDDTSIQAHIHAPWIQSLQSFLAHTDITITTPDISCNVIIRNEDKTIMALATRFTNNTNHLHAINSCRIWLQVTTLAEITEDSGSSILRTAIMGEIDTNGLPKLWNISTSLSHWPHQPRPPKRSWKIWQKMLQHFTSHDSTTLKQALGQWNTNWNKQRNWLFLSNKSQRTIKWQPKDGQALFYHNHRRTTNRLQTFNLTTTNDVYSDFIHPVTPSLITHEVLHISLPNSPAIGPQSQKGDTSDIHRPIPNTNKATPINRHKTMYVSIHTTHAYEIQTFTWSITQNNLSHTIKGIVQHTHSRKCATSRGGLIGTLQAIQYIAQHSQAIRPSIPQQPIIICSKDIKVLRQLNKLRHRLKSSRVTMEPEQELLQTIFTLLKQHQIQILTHHATKHDDANNLRTQNMNKCIDHITNTTTSTRTSYKPQGLATVWHVGEEVTDQIAETIRHAAGTMDLRAYMQKKYKWNDATIENIDWMIHSQALQNLQPNDRKTCTQFIHGWLPTCGHPGQLKIATSQTCPICKEQIESQAHFLSCPNRAIAWEENLTQAILPDKDNSLHQQLINILRWSLTKCRLQNETNIPHVDHKLQRLVETQQAIGWKQILCGRWTTEWVLIYDIIFPNQGEKYATTQLTSIWHAVLTTWKQRCELLHDPETNNPSLFKKNLEPKVRALYTMKHAIDHIDQQALQQPMETTMKLPVKLLRGWIQQTDKFIRQALRRRKKRLKNGTHAITNFFKPKTNTPTGIQIVPLPARTQAQRRQTQIITKDTLKPP
jgi:hypothetical protein